MVSVNKEKNVKCFLKHRVGHVVLFTKVVHLIQEAGKRLDSIFVQVSTGELTYDPV